MADDKNTPQKQAAPGKSGRLGVFGFLEQERDNGDIKTAEPEIQVSRAPSIKDVAPPETMLPGREPAAVAAQPARIGTTPPQITSASQTLTILVLEDYPDVMDTVVTNIKKYLHPSRGQRDAQALPDEHYYTIQGIERINIVQASTPYEALNYIGNYDQNSRSFTTLHERVYQETLYGVFDVVLGHYLSGIDVLDIIKRHVPQFHALILTAQTNTDQEIARTVELADAYRKKQASLDPAKRYLLAQDIAENVNRILSEMRIHEQMARSKALVSTMPDLLAVVIDYYDFITGAHSRGVTDLAMFIGEELKSNPQYSIREEYGPDSLDLEMLGFNAVLHDVGKVVIPKRILTKTGIFSKEEDDLVRLLCSEVSQAVMQETDLSDVEQQRLVKVIENFAITRDHQQDLKLHGRLTPAELDVMRFHIAAGELIRDDFRPCVEKKLNDSALVEYIMRLFDGLYHHEKPDGSGYLYGFQGQDFSGLPVASKIILCADVYHALRSRRSYKEAMEHDKAIGIMRKLAGADTVVNDCVDVLTELPQHIIDSVNEMNFRRIARLIQRVRHKVESIGSTDAGRLFADLMGSNAIDPADYKTNIE